MKKYDVVLIVLIILMGLSLAVYGIGSLFNSGEGWPVTRNGMNLFWLLAPITAVYLLLSPILNKFGIKNKLILSSTSLMMSVIIVIVVLYFLFLWALASIMNNAT
jgi:hypothetical protein